MICCDNKIHYLINALIDYGLILWSRQVFAFNRLNKRLIVWFNDCLIQFSWDLRSIKPKYSLEQKLLNGLKPVQSLICFIFLLFFRNLTIFCASKITNHSMNFMIELKLKSYCQFWFSADFIIYFTYWMGIGTQKTIT